MIIISKHLQTPKTFWMSVVLLSLLFLEYLKTPQGNQRIKWPSWPPEGRGRAASAAANYCNPPKCRCSRIIRCYNCLPCLLLLLPEGVSHHSC